MQTAIKKGDTLTAAKLSRRFWPRAVTELTQLGYVVFAGKSGRLNTYKVTRNLPDADVVREEAIDKIYTKPVQAWIEIATEDLRALADEIGEWKDNMECTPLAETDKFQVLDVCYDALGDAATELEDLTASLPEGLPPLLVRISTMGSRVKTGRQHRLSAVVQQLTVARDEIETWANDAADQEEEQQRMEMTDETTDILYSVIGEIDFLEIPGMY